MKKLLIVSDIHYPYHRSEILGRIIKREKPDNVVLLGDTVEGSYDKKHIVKLYKRFFRQYSKFFPISRTIVIMGDNDYRNNKHVVEYLRSLNSVNKSNIYRFRIGNMFFFHGNIEKYRVLEKTGYITGNIIVALNERLLQRLLALLIRFRYNVNGKIYAFIGHIHYLGSIGNTVFCGTLLEGKRLNHIRKDLPMQGYVTVLHDNFFIKNGAKIKLVSI